MVMAMQDAWKKSKSGCLNGGRVAGGWCKATPVGRWAVFGVWRRLEAR
jgi:hypothetical protein